MIQLRTGLFIMFSLLWLSFLATLLMSEYAFLKDWLLLGILLVVKAVLFLPFTESVLKGSRGDAASTAVAAAGMVAAAAAAPKPRRLDRPAAADDEDVPVFEVVTVPKPNENRPASARVARAVASHHAPLRESELGEPPRVMAVTGGTLFAPDVNGTAAVKLTKGVCGHCGTRLTLSARRPLRATCPVCGHSKVLN